MPYLVKKDFIDKHTGEEHKAGDVIDIAEERASEILATCEVILPLDELIAAYSPAQTEAVLPEGEKKVAAPSRRTRAKKEGDAK